MKQILNTCAVVEMFVNSTAIVSPSMFNLFQNEVPHLLDLELSPDGISIFRKNTNTGFYSHFSSYVP